MNLRYQFPEYSFHSDASLFDSGLNQGIKDYKSLSNVDSNKTSSGKQRYKAVYHEQVGSIKSIQYFNQLTIRVSSTKDLCHTSYNPHQNIKEWGITLVARHFTSRGLNLTSCKIICFTSRCGKFRKTNKVTTSNQILWTLKRYFCSSMPIPYSWFVWVLL